jgi:hypothetical protein
MNLIAHRFDSSGAIRHEYMRKVGFHAKLFSEPALSFAKNASTGIALRRRAFVTVMQAAKVRNLDDRSDTRDLPNRRTLLVES